MAYGEYDQDTDPERERLEREELQRQLTDRPPTTAGPASPTSTKPVNAPYTPPKAGEDLSSGFGEDHASASGALSNAATFGAIGSKVGGPVGGLVGAGIGSVTGYLQGRTNDAKNEREKFAQSLGLADSTALWQRLDSTLPADQATELRDRALNRIGKHDMAANAQWMRDVEAAMAAAPPKSATAPAVDPASPAAPSTTPAPTTPRAKTDTRLLEGDPAKFADPAHIAKSPKYQFLSNVTNYSRGQENELLNQLKTQYGAHWNGWEWDGRGNFVFKGDPATLHPDWKGVTRVDAFGSYNAGGPLQARWGANDNGAPAAAAMPSGGGSVDGGSPSLVPTDTNFYNQLQAKLAEILGGPEAFDREALLKKLLEK